ncbi:MAG: ATP-binding protein, partial [Pseudomonadales bacterium]|nr:ATP-binding protein [Pseudomonadales bacterium]
LVTGLNQELQEQFPQLTATLLVEPECAVWADEAMLHSMLQNLLNNAWKYSSKQQQIHIEFGRIQSAAPVPEGVGSIPETVPEKFSVFYIRDQGCGFDMAHAGQLFDSFQRLHRNTDFEGAGIGLATVKRIVEKHHGAIWANAAPGEGATFYFMLPVSALTASD